MRRRDMFRLPLALGFACIGVSLAGCERASPDRPRKITLGRDVCEHCAMLISDPRYMAQLWDPKLRRYHLFDDVGCAVIYARENSLPEDPSARLWVGDSERSGEWLDAHAAFFRTDGKSPMGYDFAAMRADGPKRVSLAEIRRLAAEKALCTPSAGPAPRAG